MAYTYNTIQLDQVDSAGVSFQSIGSFTAATIPAVSDLFAIGNRIKLTLTIDASGADTFTNKLLRVNPGMFVISTTTGDLTFTPFPSPVQLQGFESNGVLTNVAVQCNFIGNVTYQNIECYMSVDVTFLIATIELYFYVTMDIFGYVGTNPNGSTPNLQRLLSASTAGTFYNANVQSVYKQTKNLGIIARVFDFATFSQAVIEPVGSLPFLHIPSRARWFNTDYLGISTGMRFIKEIEITSPSQIAAGINMLTDATATAAQATTPPTFVTSIYTVVNNQLAVGEMNSVRILLRGDSFVGSLNNAAISDVRIMLLRFDDVTNATDFVSDYSLSDAKILPAIFAAAQIDNAIWSPTDWFENVPIADDIEIQFTIDGSQLELDGGYFIIVNIYDSVTDNYVTAHLSPQLVASYSAPVIPTIIGYLSAYNKEYTGNQLQIAPHQRIKSSLAISKASYDAILVALGITGTFDSSLFGVICKLENVTGVVNQVQGYIPTAIPPALTSNMSVIVNDATDLRLESIFRISEVYAGLQALINWTLTFYQPVNNNGSYQEMQVLFTQKLDVDAFENDNIVPNLLAIKFYDRDLYVSGTKTEIIEICDVDQIIAEVEKTPLFVGSIMLVATLYPANEIGRTTPSAIEEEEDWFPIVIQMVQEVSGKIDDVETGFFGDDFATFRINCQQLTQGQRYFVTAIAYNQIPTYCPLGINAVISNTTSWVGTAANGWSLSANCTNVMNQIQLHPDYVGGITIVEHSLKNASSVLVGALQNTVGNVLGVQKIDTLLTEVYYKLVINAVFNSGFGNHLVQHVLTETVPRPVYLAPAIVTLMNVYSCTDLG